MIKSAKSTNIGSGSSGTRTITRKHSSSSLSSFNEDEEITEPRNKNVALYQEIIRIFDSLSPKDRELLLALSSAFAAMRPEDRVVIINAAERLSGLVG